MDTSSINHIDVVINEAKDNSWRFTPCESWSLLKNLNHRVSLPWLCTRDFRETLDACGFASLGFVGNKFIWCKRLIGRRGGGGD